MTTARPRRPSPILAVIPARGGSKGLPRKNLLPLDGRPLIEHTVSTALDTARELRVVVSTDDPEIASVAADCGAEVPFVRPDELATDEASSVDVVRHVLDALDEAEGYEPTIVVLLQPTSPLRRPEQVEAALDLLEISRADSVVSVSPCAHPPEWLRVIDARGMVHPLPQFDLVGGRRQDFPAYFRLNGAIYVTSPQVIRSGNLLGERCAGLVMPEEDSVDIDTASDLVVAHAMLRWRQRGAEGERSLV